MRDLNDLIPDDSGWLLKSAYAINDSGEIVGIGEYNGEERAYKLSVAPEPVSFILFLAGAALFGGRAVFRKTKHSSYMYRWSEIPGVCI